MYLTSAFFFPLSPFKNKKLRAEEIAKQLDHLLLLQKRTWVQAQHPHICDYSSTIPMMPSLGTHI